jgi:signal peptidase
MGSTSKPGELVVGSRSTGQAMLTRTAPPETGYYRTYLPEYRSMFARPRPMILALYAIHPWLLIVGIDAMLGVPFYLIGIGLAGFARLRPRSRAGPSRVPRLLNNVGVDIQYCKVK